MGILFAAVALRSATYVGPLREGNEGLERLRGDFLCPLGESMFLHRTRGEKDYPEDLWETPDVRLDASRGAPYVDGAVWVWNKARLGVQFRNLRKNGRYWNIFSRTEGRLRSNHGLAVPNQWPATFCLCSEFFRRALGRLTPFWQRLEVSRACAVELKPFSAIECAF